MKHVIKVTMLLSALIQYALYAGDTAGHGGDGIRFTFLSARDEASLRVSKFSLKKISKSVSLSPAAQWVVDHSSELSLDILGSKHVWVESPTKACAHTDLLPNSPIILSYVSCQNTNQIRDNIVRMLIHESVHHFGFSDETFADVVANEVVQATRDENDLDCVARPGSFQKKYFTAAFGRQTDVEHEGYHWQVDNYPNSIGMGVYKTGYESRISFAERNSKAGSLSLILNGKEMELSCWPHMK